MVLLGILGLGAPISLPFLDAGEPVEGAHVESSHDEAQCLRLHDHAACAQLTRSFGGVWPVWAIEIHPDRTEGSLRTPTTLPPVRPAPTNQHSRGPPTNSL
jgi:hypothetical protein